MPFPQRIAILGLAGAAALLAQPVAVRRPEGIVRGFLLLSDVNGEVIASGDSAQLPTKANQITNRLTFRFKDGSLQEETVVFTQSGHFHVISDRLVQEGPAFKHPIDMTVNGSTGQVTVKTTDDNGQPKVYEDRIKPPPDLANGIVPVILKNLPPGVQSTTQSMVVATPKPLVVKLEIAAEGEDSFTIGAMRQKATRYKIHVDIGGVKGVLASVVGKQPPDTRVWIAQGDCPGIVKSEGPSFEGGPIWVTELARPIWPGETTEAH
ncbi:MAG: hypothetical protein ABSH56_30890 [Bryobacteraceae bacterium]|jgi:hypothetical protein